MKIRYVVRLIMFLGVLLFIISCDESPPKTTSVDFVSKITESSRDKEYGSEIKIKFITGEGNHWQIQETVQKKLELFINSGQHEIVRVVTTRCNSSEAHLLSAEVYYYSKK